MKKKLAVIVSMLLVGALLFCTACGDTGTNTDDVIENVERV